MTRLIVIVTVCFALGACATKKPNQWELIATGVGAVIEQPRLVQDVELKR